MPGNSHGPTDFHEATLSELMGEIGIGTWRWNPVTGTVDWDPTTERVYGMEEGTFPGTFDSFVERIHPDDREEAIAVIGRVAYSGGDYSIRHRTIWPNGEIRWLEGQGRIQIGDAGSPIAGFGIVYDVTERYTDELERSELLAKELAARDELRFLIEAGDRLTGSLNTERVVERLADLLVPRLATSCVIDVRLDHPIGWILTCVRRGDDLPQLLSGPAGSLPEAASRLRQAEGAVADTMHAAVPTDFEEPSMLEADEETIHSVPLLAHGSVIGSVTAVTHPTEPDRATDAELLAAVCDRAAVALAHAELYTDRSRFISLFQTSETPVVRDIPGLSIAVHYRPATDLVRLSGDLYDVFDLGDGSWTIAIGDVCGKGVDAAGHAELSRSALRAAVLSNPDPVDALRVLNRVLLADRSRPMLTLVILRCTVRDDSVTITAAAAGHPPPLVANDSGWREIDIQGTMLGVVDNPKFKTQAFDLEPDSCLVLYSDGVIEARFGDELFGIDRLGDVIAATHSGPAQGVADDIGSAVDMWTSGHPVDDVLAVVVKSEEPTR